MIYGMLFIFLLNLPCVHTIILPMFTFSRINTYIYIYIIFDARHTTPGTVYNTVEVSVRWSTGERLTNRLPNLSLMTCNTLPPFGAAGSYNRFPYGAVHAY